MVYTKEFPRGILDQVISETKPTGDGERAPGPGLKLQAPSDSNSRPQASSDKQQASSSKRHETNTIKRYKKIWVQ